MKTGRMVIFVAVLLAIGQCLYFGPRLPATMASHFGANGQPDGSQSKGAFLGFDLFIVALLTAIFTGMPLLIRRLPVSMINLPNKDYWLAPERRDESLAFLANQLELIGGSALLLVVAVMQLAFNANLSNAPTMPPTLIWPPVVAFIGFELVCTVRLMWRFGARQG